MLGALMRFHGSPIGRLKVGPLVAENGPGMVIFSSSYST